MIERSSSAMPRLLALVACAVLAGAGQAGALQCGGRWGDGYLDEHWYKHEAKPPPLTAEQRAEYRRVVELDLREYVGTTQILFVGRLTDVVYAGRAEQCNPCFYTMTFDVSAVYRGNVPKKARVQYYGWVDGIHSAEQRAQTMSMLRFAYSPQTLVGAYDPRKSSLLQPWPGEGNRMAQIGIGPCELPIRLDETYRPIEFPTDAPHVELGAMTSSILKTIPKLKFAQP